MVSSFPGKIFMTQARGQSPLCVSSTTRTKSPTLTLHVLWFHLFRAIRVGRYSRNHLTQTWLIMTCVCLHRFLLEISLSVKTPQGSTGFARDIRKWFGVMASKSLLIELTSVRGLLFTRASVSANAVSRTSSVTTWPWRTTFRAFLQDWTKHSRIPPKWGVAGGLECHWISFWDRKVTICDWFHSCKLCFSSRSAPTKLEPLSE